MQNSPGRGFINLPRLDTHQPVFNHIASADAVFRAEMAKLINKFKGVISLAVYLFRDSLVKFYLYMRWLVRRLIRRISPLITILRRADPRVLQDAGFYGYPP